MGKRPLEPDFERILLETHQQVRSFLGALGVPLDVVDDIAQEAYVAFYMQHEKKPKGVEDGAWIRGIARNLAMSYFRQEKKRSNRWAAVMEVLAQSTDAAASESEMLAESETILHRCLSKLSKRHRSVIECRYEKGLSPKEMSGILGMSSEAIRILLFRIRGILRDCIQAELKQRIS